MGNAWKKWFTNPGGMQVVLVFLYMLAIFGIPLGHICKLSDKDRHDYHSGYISYHPKNDSSIRVHHTIFNQNILSGKTDSHDLYCSVCLYSLTSKAFWTCSNISLHSTHAVKKTQILPQLSFTKQLEWFCSAPLRAPPHIAS